MQEILGFLKPKDDGWRPPNFSELPSSWAGMKRVGIDTETRDPFLKETGPGGGRIPDSYSTGISIAFEDDRSFYLPIRHQGGDNMDEQKVLEYLRYQAKHFTGQIIGMNLGYDLDILAADGIWFGNAEYFRDVQIAAVLIDELQNSYSLDSIAKRLGFPGKDETLLRQAAQAYNLDPKKSMWKLPARYVGPYAAHDALLPMQVLRKQEYRIEEDNLWSIFNLESQLLPILIKMRRKGIRIDLDKLAKIEQWSLEQEALELAKIKHITGFSIAVGDVWKNKALVPVLEHVGIKLGLTAKGAKSIDKDLLSSNDHPVCQALGRARKVSKLRTTFAQSVRNHMVNGRIHCTLNQMAKEDDGDEDEVKGARYGRLSCEHPNLQQQPSKDDFAKAWREIYIPEEGQLWASNDYSQQEPRWTTHFAEVLGLPRAAEAAERYRTDPDADNHQMMAELAGIDRKPAKEIFLGLCYGMGGGKLCKKLGLPSVWYKNEKTGRTYEIAGPEGQALLDKFDSQVPFVRKLANSCKEAANRRGHIKTILGRRLHFPIDMAGNYDWTHKALNRLIQGSSADQTKKAIVECDKAGYLPMIQVHDELAHSVNNRAEAEEISIIMRDCVQARVPFKVDLEIGPSWGEAV